MSYQRPPDSSRELAFFILCIVLLLLLLWTPLAHGQTESPSGPPSLTELLKVCEQNLQTLSDRLTERQAQVQDLRDNLRRAEARLTDSLESLTVLRARLEEAVSSQEKLRTDLQETQTLYDALLRQYNALGESWQAYRSEMKAQVADLERGFRRARRWAVVFGVATTVAVSLMICLQ